MDEALQGAEHRMLPKIRRAAGVGRIVGIVAFVAGLIAILSPLVAGLSVAIAVGVLLLVNGFSRLFFAFGTGAVGHALPVFLMGLISVLAGGLMVARPGLALATLTLVLAAYLAVDGLFHIAWALRLKPLEGWGLNLFSGIAGLVLAILIWSQFPVSGAWAVGTLVGLQLIFGGSALSSICGAAKRATRPAKTRHATT